MRWLLAFLLSLSACATPVTRDFNIPMCSGGERGYWMFLSLGDNKTSLLITTELDDFESAICYVNINRRILADFQHKSL
jgi:hypothetical protein